MKYTRLSVALAMMTLGLTLGLMSAAAFAQGSQDVNQRQAQRAPASKVHILTREELDKLLAQPRKVLLIDVRRPDEISSIGGFPVYLSIQINDLKNSLDWIPRDRTLVTVSNHAARASKAAILLSAHGFRVAGAVGAQTYAKEGGTLAKVAIPQPKAGNRAAAQAAQ